MRTLVIGGSASGKSTFAETLAVSGAAPLYYIATMMPYDDESIKRIKKHQAVRARKSFATIECYRDLDRVKLPARGTVLLECLGTLTANELFAPDCTGLQTNAADLILAGFMNLEKQCSELIVVTNDVFSDGIRYDKETNLYMETLGAVNRELARHFERVIEVVCGIPILHKGALE